MRRAAGLIAALSVGVVLILAGLAVVAVTLSGDINPQASRPCVESYAQSLGKDAILTVALPGETDAAASAPDASCADSDGGGVSWASQRRYSISAPSAIAAHFADAARGHGWRDAHLTGEHEMGLAYPGPGVCGHLTRDGHNLTLRLQFERVLEGASGASYAVSITGDEGNFPSC